jgi:hypothetical protein
MADLKHIRVVVTGYGASARGWRPRWQSRRTCRWPALRRRDGLAGAHGDRADADVALPVVRGVSVNGAHGQV